MKLKKVYKHIVLILLMFVCLFGINEVFAFGPSDDRIYQGIDVSEWQGNIDFNQVREAGIEAVYIRSSEGSDYIDHYFESNYVKAREAGLKIGFYHYVTARTVEEGRQQARFFASVISSKEVDLRLAMDFESFGNLSVNEINDISEAFLTTLEEITEKEVVIYSDASNARDIFSRELADTYPIWVAEYFVNEPSDNGKWETWVGFQYTDRGRISGISDSVDRDEFTNGIFLDERQTLPESENKPETERTTEYVVKRGDTLTKIAIEFDTTVERLVQENNIRNRNLIFPGEVLKITNVNNPTRTVEYVVRRGNTLSQIARNYGTTVQALVQENNISNPNLIFPGEILTIGTKTYDRYDMLHTIYRVRAGNTLSQIARKYNTTVRDLAEINNIQNVNRIYVGEVLRIN